MSEETKETVSPEMAKMLETMDVIKLCHDLIKQGLFWGHASTNIVKALNFLDGLYTSVVKDAAKLEDADKVQGLKEAAEEAIAKEVKA